jgi:hypothetical protein
VKRFFNWILRWISWIPILFAVGKDSSEYFVGMAALAVGVGIAPAFPIFLAFLEPGQTWLPCWVAVFITCVWYLLVGLYAYIALPGGSGYGHWTERGAW